MKKKPIVYEIGKKCDICGKDRWVGISEMTRYFILVGAHGNVSMVFMEDKKTGKPMHLIGIKSNGKECCLLCFELLLGLEEYYDAFFPHIIAKNEVKRIINNILAKKKNFEKAAFYREKGKSLPNQFIKLLL